MPRDVRESQMTFAPAASAIAPAKTCATAIAKTRAVAETRAIATTADPVTQGLGRAVGLALAHT